MGWGWGEHLTTWGISPGITNHPTAVVRAAYGPRSKARANVSNGRRERRRRMVVCRVC